MDSKQVLLTVGWLFLGTAILGVIVFISFTFQLDLFEWERTRYSEAEIMFDYVGDGGASNAPIFLGLLAMTGAFLVSKHIKT